MPDIVDIADAVVTELNAAGGGTFSQTFTAQRHYLPVFDLAEMKDLHVTVVPKTESIATAGRDRNQHDVQIDVAVQKKLAAPGNNPDDLGEIDALMGLVEEIADFFRLRRLQSQPDAVWTRTEHAPVYFPDHLEQFRQFTAVVTFTFRLFR